MARDLHVINYGCGDPQEEAEFLMRCVARLRQSPTRTFVLGGVKVTLDYSLLDQRASAAI